MEKPGTDATNKSRIRVRLPSKPPLLYPQAARVLRGGVGRLAFYGRCSTEDNQDPKTSKAWQLGEATRFVEPLGGVIVEEFFDIGQSRSLPWERRDEANRALQALKNPNRGWDGLVVGEATRCWFGNQFGLAWPKFDRYGVSLWIPSLGGRFDAENTVHDMAMTITADCRSRSGSMCSVEFELRWQLRSSSGSSPCTWKASVTRAPGSC